MEIGVFSIRAGQLQPLPVIEIPNDGCFLDKHILDPEMVNGRRLGSAVSVIVAHDEVFAYGVYSSCVDPFFISRNSLDLISSAVPAGPIGPTRHSGIQDFLHFDKVAVEIPLCTSPREQ